MKRNHSMQRVIFWAVAGALATAATANAGLSSMSFDLTMSDDYGAGNYGRVDIVADNVAGTVNFTVTAYDNLPQYDDLSRFGFDRFYFNFDSSAVSNGASSWDVDNPYRWYHHSSGSTSGYGNFDAYERTYWSSYRKSTLNFTIELDEASEAVASNFAEANGDGFFFAGRIGGFEDDSEGGGGSKHWVAATAPVPAPGATMLGLVGLAVLSRFRRSDLFG